ncbi:MAG TPA: hypothetical protein PLJ60_03425 [Chryseolinea sp.]|nr:hypothetical protein [Chryseolinea sp.]HPH45447.1 hypothetical protein [Chryseolinea sp.]HPM29365.1 hypothetical protein [Chryseolinea sp.]
MKTSILSITFVLTFAFASAQQLKVESKTIKNQEGKDIEAWVAHLDQNTEDCMESYEDFMKDVFNLKTSKENKTMMMAEKVMLTEMSDLRLDQRTFFITESAGTAVGFTFSPGYDLHFGTKLYESEFEKGEKLVKSFVKFHYKDFYNKKIKVIQNALVDKQDEITSDEKKIDKNKRSMLDNNKKISNGDSDAAKLRIKNDSLEKENVTLEAQVASDRSEIKSLQDQLIKFQESLSKVDEF